MPGSAPRALLVALAIALAVAPLPRPLAAQATTGTVAGRVVNDAGAPIAQAVVSLTPHGIGPRVDGTTTADGRFMLRVAGGSHALDVRAIAHRPASRPTVRVQAGDTLELRIVLVRAITQLSTVEVVRSPVTVDALAPELAVELDRRTVLQLPLPRDAAAAIALVPGAREGRLWGGAGAATNSYRVDGLPFNDPGAGGDALALPRDWVERLEVRGLGANAEFGDFQGGMIDAVTRSGRNLREVTARLFHEADALTASQIDGVERGATLVQRSEASAEAAGPLVRDRLHYFTGVQFTTRRFSAADLSTPDPSDRMAANEERRDLRAMAKLTWSRALGERADLVAGLSDRTATDAGLDGLDRPSALPRATARTAWFIGSWRRPMGSTGALELRVSGQDGASDRVGGAGREVPAIHPIGRSETARWQNATFDEEQRPRTASASLAWRRTARVGRLEHQLAAGAELQFARWRDWRTRNGQLTWRPYPSDTLALDPTDVGTWTTVGSEWGGETRLSTRTSTAALFVQDAITLGDRLTVAPGVRFTQGRASATPCASTGGVTQCSGSHDLLTAASFDPRIGLSWDPTGRGVSALKLHWGRYHQGMYALLFDRAEGIAAYSDQRFHYTAPPLTDTRQTFTPAERDTMISPTRFSPAYDIEIRSEAGRVEGYRQPHVDQISVSFEQRIGARVRASLLAIDRRNGDITGLVDRALATNYTRLDDIGVDHRLIGGAILDANGRPLRLRELWVSNRDLVDAVTALNANTRPGQPPVRFAGYGPDEVAALAWAPDIVLGAVPAARRRYRQLTLTLTALLPTVRIEGAATIARLVGNVQGVTGHGSSGTLFSAGPFVRRNELVNANGPLPDVNEFEGKFWMIGRLPLGMEGGLLYTHVLGERITPSVTLQGRYRYTDASGVTAPAELLRQVLGQRLFVEPRGSRNYASRGIIDLHLERAFDLRGTRLAVSADLFNALGSRALVRVKTEIDDRAAEDPTSALGAPRERVAPRSLRLGVHIIPLSASVP